jgi:hypothetical protein
MTVVKINVAVTNVVKKVLQQTVVITNADISIVDWTNVLNIFFDQMLQGLTYELPYLQKEVANDSASSR